jgi:hypothetical protein
VNHESRDIWQTPQDLWDKLHAQYGFSFDACADRTNYKVLPFCEDFGRIYFTDMMPEPMIWMNPPFSKALAMFQRLATCHTWVAIYRSDNFETKVWQDVIFPACDWVFMFNYRVKYTGFEGDSSRFPSALIGRGVPPPSGLEGICFFPLQKMEDVL